jgi:hypothetical protein
MPTIDLCARHQNATIVGPSSEESCVICQTASAEQEEARNRLLQAMPHFRFAMKEAAKKGAPHVGILSVQPDGSGGIEAKFAAPDFFNDLALVLGAPPQSKEDDMMAGATRLVQQVQSGLVDIGSGTPGGEPHT